MQKKYTQRAKSISHLLQKTIAPLGIYWSLQTLVLLFRFPGITNTCFQKSLTPFWGTWNFYLLELFLFSYCLFKNIIEMFCSKANFQGLSVKERKYNRMVQSVSWPWSREAISSWCMVFLFGYLTVRLLNILLLKQTIKILLFLKEKQINWGSTLKDRRVF